MNRIILLLSLIFSFCAQASDISKVDIGAMEFIKSPLAKLNLPAIFVWDDKQKPVYFHAGKQDYKQAITNIVNGETEAIENPESFKFVKKYLTKSKNWDSDKQVIVFATIDKSFGACQPCTIADEVISEREKEIQKTFNTISLAVVNK